MKVAVAACAASVTAALAIVPSIARADAPPSCAIVPGGDAAYQSALLPLLSSPGPVTPGLATPIHQTAEPAARSALGDQFTLAWLSTADQGWDVGLAPGPLDLEQARAAILAQLAASYSPDRLAALAGYLHVVAEPYSASQLSATLDAAVAALSAAGWSVSGSVGLCTLSDAIRVEIMVFSSTLPLPAAQAAQVDALLAPFGDQVRWVASSPAVAMVGAGSIQPPSSPPGGAQPQPKPQPPATPRVRVATYVSLPPARRCVRGGVVHVRPRASRALRSIAVKANGRSARSSTAPVAVRLRHHRTKLTITATLADGRSGTRTLTLTRCR